MWKLFLAVNILQCFRILYIIGHRLFVLVKLSVPFLQVLDMEYWEYCVILIEPLEQAGLSGYTWVSVGHTVGVTSLLRCLTSVMKYFTNSWIFRRRIICNVNMTCDMTDVSRDWCHIHWRHTSRIFCIVEVQSCSKYCLSF